jgi:hypothetical protein
MSAKKYVHANTSRVSGCATDRYLPQYNCGGTDLPDTFCVHTKK